MKNYEITLSVSKECYLNKSEIQFNKISYLKHSISFNQFIYLIKKGYCFAHNFNSEIINQHNKTIKNFESAKCIFVDIDDVCITMNEFVNKLSNKPSIAYTTYSDCEVIHSFRLVYLLNNYITSSELYKEVYFNIIRKIEEETHIKNKDNCAQSVAQQFTSNPDCELYVNNKIFNIEDFSYNTIGHSNYIIKAKENIIELESPIEKECNSNYIIKEERNIIELEMHFSKEFLNDYFNLDYKSFIDKYNNVYPFFTNTELTEVDDDTAYILLTDNYIEIKRYWMIDKQVNEEGETLRINSTVRKIKDGENRRKKLFINGILRRFMKSEISYEYMLTMLVYELYYFIDNRKDKITKKDLFTICNNAMKADLSKYTELSHQEHPSFIVNDNYCIKYNINRKQARNIAKKQITYAEIGNLYDCLLSDKDNLKIMKENGLNISQKTLTRFKQDNGLTRNYNKKEIGHSNYIIKEEKNIIELESPIEKVDNTTIIEEYEEENVDYTFLQILNKRVDEMFEEQIKMMNEINNNINMNNTMNKEERNQLIEKLIKNTNILLNKLKQIDNIEEIETKYDMLNEYIYNKSKSIQNFDCINLLKTVNQKYLKIKDDKNFDYRFDEFNFNTYRYAA